MASILSYQPGEELNQVRAESTRSSTSTETRPVTGTDTAACARRDSALGFPLRIQSHPTTTLGQLTLLPLQVVGPEPRHHLDLPKKPNLGCCPDSSASPLDFQLTSRPFSSPCCQPEQPASSPGQPPRRRCPPASWWQHPPPPSPHMLLLAQGEATRRPWARRQRDSGSRRPRSGTRRRSQRLTSWASTSSCSSWRGECT